MAGRLKPTLRRVHTAGERIFVDFAGHAKALATRSPSG
jgi:hypothetical protein